MKGAKLAAAGLLAFFSTATPAATTITVTDLPIPGGTVRIATHRPDAPRANLIFLGGGNNIPDLQMNGDGANPVFFLDIQYRSRQHFVDLGYSFIRVDSPTYLYPVGMDWDYRISANTPNLIRAVLEHVLAKDNIPTWVLGHSAGSLSTVNGALNVSSALPFGIVMTSPPSYLPNTVVPGGVLDMNLEGIKRPALVISHAQDTCINTDPANSRLVALRLTGASVSGHVELTGGENPAGQECATSGYHAFGGLEAEYAAAIVNWTARNAHLASAPNYTSLWWNAAESGWGLNVNHQGDTIFATLFTYDTTGAPMWLFLSNGARQTDGMTFSGLLYRATGPAFHSVPFTPITAANLTVVGTMSITFSSIDRATLAYTVNGVQVSKAIQRQQFGSRVANCAPSSASRAALTNYQDLWWNAAESGWGINVTHQDEIIFATLFTYGTDGKDLWLFLSAGLKQLDGSYQGDLYRATGPAFHAQPFTPITLANLAKVGTMRLTFSNGETGTVQFTVDGIPVTKQITRQMFGKTAPSCS